MVIIFYPKIQSKFTAEYNSRGHDNTTIREYDFCAFVHSCSRTLVYAVSVVISFNAVYSGFTSDASTLTAALPRISTEMISLWVE